MIRCCESNIWGTDGACRDCTPEEKFAEIVSGAHRLSTHMKHYIATPYCKDTQNNNYVACESVGITGIEAQGVQAHGGDLFQHSQWSVLYVRQWYRQSYQSELSKQWPSKRSKFCHQSPGLDQPVLSAMAQGVVLSDLFIQVVGPTLSAREMFLEMCAFFHDIGKGGDGIWDMYASYKYGGQGDHVHPEKCADAILNPKNLYYGVLADTLTDLFSTFSRPPQARLIMAICASQHWEFGKLNMDPQHGGITSRTYVDNIDHSTLVHKLGLLLPGFRFRKTLIELCMLISCADIASAYPCDLVEPESSDAAEMTHRSEGGAWRQYQMDIKCTPLIASVLRLVE